MHLWRRVVGCQHCRPVKQVVCSPVHYDPPRGMTRVKLSGSWAVLPCSGVSRQPEHVPTVDCSTGIAGAKGAVVSLTACGRRPQQQQSGSAFLTAH